MLREVMTLLAYVFRKFLQISSISCRLQQPNAIRSFFPRFSTVTDPPDARNRGILCNLQLGIRRYRQRINIPMRRAARFVVENATRQIKPVNGLPRLLTITTPQKHGKENNSNDSVLTKDENTEPLVAFSRPPPWPPVLGPLIVLKLFDMSSGGDEDKK